MKGWLFFDKSYLNWQSKDTDSSVKILKHILKSSMFQYEIRGIRFNGIPQDEMEELRKSMISGIPTQSKYEDWIIQVSKIYATGLGSAHLCFDNEECSYNLKTAYEQKGRLNIKGVNEKDFLNSIFFVNSTMSISDCFGHDWITNDMGYEQFLTQSVKFIVVNHNEDADNLFQNILAPCKRSNAFVLIDRYVCKNESTISLNFVKIFELLRCHNVDEIPVSIYTQFDGAEITNIDEAKMCVLSELSGRLKRKNLNVYNMSTQFHDRILFLSNGLILSFAGFDLVESYGHGLKRVNKDTSLMYIAKTAMLANDNLYEIYHFYKKNLLQMMKNVPNTASDTNRLLPSEEMVL